MYAFFDLDRLLHMKDSKMYQTKVRHMRKYVVISLVIVMEQFCREMVQVQAETASTRTSVWKKLFSTTSDNATLEIDALRNFQNMRVITRTLAKYGITGIFDGEDSAELKHIMGTLTPIHHDYLAIGTTDLPMLDSPILACESPASWPLHGTPRPP